MRQTLFVWAEGASELLYRPDVQPLDGRHGHAHDLSDLGFRQLLVVEERDDQLLAFRQPGDGGRQFLTSKTPADVGDQRRSVRPVAPARASPR